MARDIPLVGVTLSPEVKPNSAWYELANTKSNTVTPSTPAPTSLASSIGDRAYSFTTRRGRTYELGRIEAGECQLKVDNSDSLFDPNNTSGAFYPNLLPFKPVQITCAYPTTGNILNDTNLAPVGSNSSRISVSANDSNFDLGAVGNWYVFTGGLSVASSPTPHSGSYSMLVSPSISAFLDVPCVANKTVTFSIWVRSSSGTTTGAISIYGGGYINSSTSATATTSFTANTTWTRYSVTALTNAPKITVNVKSTANAMLVDDAQVEFGSSASTNTTTGSTVYSLFNGFVERYPQSYQAPNRGEANLIATDAVASLSQVSLSNFYQSLVLQDSSPALYYYPLNEPSGAVLANNAGIYNQPPLTNYLFNATPTPIIFGDALAESGVPGGGSTGVTTYAASGASTATLTGNFLGNQVVNDINFDSNNTTYTFSFWVKPAYQTTDPDYLFTVNYYGDNSTVPAGQNFFSVGIYPGATNKFAIFTRSNSGNVNFVSTVTADNAQWYFLSLKVTYTGGNSYDMSLTVNNVTNTGTWVNGDQNMRINNFYLGGVGSITSTQTIGTTFAHLTINKGAITPSQYHATGAYAQWTDSSVLEQTGTKFANTLTHYSGFPYLPVANDAGVSQFQPITPSNSLVTDFIQTITDTEGGEWFVDGEGYVTFKDRHSRLKKLLPKYTFGDGAGEIAYQGGNITINYDPTYVFNDIVVTRNGGSTIPAQDQASVANYFLRSYSREVYNVADTEAVDASYFLLSRYKDPHSRPDTLTLTPARNPSVWGVALGLEIGDLVRVNKRPINGASISLDCFVERVEHNYDAQTADWVTNVTLSPVFNYYWNLSSARGVATTSSANSLVITKSATAGYWNNARDIIAGQMLQTWNGTTGYVVVVSGTPSQTSTTITLPITRVGTFATNANSILSSTLLGSILLDTTTTVTLSTSALTGTSGKYLIDSEIVSGSVSGSVLTITARSQNGTIQTAAGTDGTGNYSLSHLSGAPIYYLDAVSITPSSGGTWTEILPNQLTQLPYSVATITEDGVSVLGSWFNTLNTGTYTNSSTTVKYSTFTVNPLTDVLNYPQSDISVGQILTVGGSESVAVAQVNTPLSDATWTFSGYKVVKSSQTLSADIGLDDTTVTTSGAVTASAIVIGGEFMTVTAGSGTTSLTVTRGTPDVTTWGVLTQGLHYSGDAIYVITNAGCSGTYTVGSAIIEGYNQTSVTTGTARLGY